MLSDFEYTAITKQHIEAIEDKTPNLLLWGPGGSGKTHLGAAKAIGAAVKYANNRIFLIRRKKVDLRATLWKKFTELVPQKMIVKRDEHQMQYQTINGSEIWGLGLDSIEDVNKLASTECGLAVIEEATEIEEEHYEEKVLRSLRLPRVPIHQALPMCNPGSPAHWIHKRWIAQNLPGYKDIYMSTLPRESGILPSSFYDYLDSLTGVFRLRYRDGQWVAVEGLVYPFDPREQIIKSFKLAGGKRILCIDFGFDHPFVAQWWWISPDDKWYLYRQIYKTQRRVEDHAKDIKRFCEIDRMKPVAICDHDAENMADLRHAGIETIPAKKERLAGQQSVYKLFEQKRIFFFENSLVELDILRQMKKLPVKTEDEFALYVWANKAKEDMVKELDDGMDCMRYGIHTILSRISIDPKDLKPQLVEVKI